MKANISALMDGELEGRAAEDAIDAVAGDPEALESWRTYHLISDAMRDTRLLSRGFAGRVAARLAEEPTVVAPGRAARPAPARRFLLPAAASAAAVSLVAWLAFAPQPSGTGVPVAQAPKSAAVPVPPPSGPARVPPPAATSDYLLAHQGFSPRVSLQGMASYVRTVADSAAEARR